jgi:sigma-B regulation protein RsbU (phosphoserine phosphatase)
MPLERREQYEQEILKAKQQAEAALQNDAALAETRDELETQYRLLDKRASRLAQKNQELMQLSELIAHDFQEPLRKIILFADLLATRNASTLTPESLDYTEKIIANGQAMRQLIHSVQKYVGLDIQEPKFQLCGLSTLAYRAKTQLDAKYGDRAFRLVLKQKLPAVVCASDQVELMFYHLFENAIKFGQAGQEPVIEVEAEEIRHNTYQAIQEKYRYVDFVKITVRDSGRGFENRESDYIFGLLKKLEPDTAGYGIGLAICKKIVENHYGSISARSEPGQGAAFTVLLPQSQVV